VRWWSVIKIKVVVNRKRGNVDVRVHGLEKVYEVLKRHGFEQGDDEDGVLTWFWYIEDVDVARLIDELKEAVGAENVEHVEVDVEEQ
jgi:hypothetical protein